MQSVCDAPIINASYQKLPFGTVRFKKTGRETLPFAIPQVELSELYEKRNSTDIHYLVHNGRFWADFGQICDAFWVPIRNLLNFSIEVLIFFQLYPVPLALVLGRNQNGQFSLHGPYTWIYSLEDSHTRNLEKKGSHAIDSSNQKLNYQTQLNPSFLCYPWFSFQTRWSQISVWYVWYSISINRINNSINSRTFQPPVMIRIWYLVYRIYDVSWYYSSCSEHIWYIVYMMFHDTTVVVNISYGDGNIKRKRRCI